MLEPGQEDGSLATLVPVPHPVQSEVFPEPPLFLGPPLSHQLHQNLVTTTRLPMDHLNHPVKKRVEASQVREDSTYFDSQSQIRVSVSIQDSKTTEETKETHLEFIQEEVKMRERGGSKKIKRREVKEEVKRRYTPFKERLREEVQTG